MMSLLQSIALLQQAAGFAADAPLGIGLEWMTVAAVLLPAVLLVVLVYLGQRDTV